MQPRLDCQNLKGRVIKDVFACNDKMVLNLEGGGYFVAGVNYDYDNRVNLDYDGILNIREQHQFLLIGDEEFAAWQLEEERKATAERERQLAIRELNVEKVRAEALALRNQNKMAEVGTLMTLMRKHPDAVKQYLEFPSVMPGTTDRDRERADQLLADSGKSAESSLSGRDRC